MRVRLVRDAVIATLIVAGVLVLFSNISRAETLPPGCRVATASDLRELAARGLPSVRMVCPTDAEVLGIGKSFDQWYAKLKTQSPCNRTTCNLSCRTRNTGAQVCGSTSKNWNAIGCHSNNRTAIFPTVSHGFAAHIELLRRYCGRQGRCTIASVISRWTAVGKDVAPYAAFVSRNSGIPANQVFDPNDIELMARLALSMACFEGGALPFSAEDLKRGITMASGGERVPVPSNVGELLEQSLRGSYVPNTRASEVVPPLLYQPPPPSSAPGAPQLSYSQPPPPQYASQAGGVQPGSYFQNSYSALPGLEQFPTFGSTTASSPKINESLFGQSILQLIKPITTGVTENTQAITVTPRTSSMGSIATSTPTTHITITPLTTYTIQNPSQTFINTYVERSRPSATIDVDAVGRVLELLKSGLVRVLELLRSR